VIGDPKWNMGNLRAEEITDVWFSSKWAFFRGSVKKSDLKNCVHCKSMKGCSDFYCRLLPYIISGDPMDPKLSCLATNSG